MMAENSFIRSSDYFPDDPEQLQIKLTEMYSKMASSINSKEIGLYEQTEQLTGQLWYNLSDQQKLRNGYRRVYPFSNIPSGGTLTTPHGLQNVTQFTKISGVSFDVTGFSKPLPYAESNVPPLGYQIDLYVDLTNIYIKNGRAGIAPQILSGSVVLEYLKD